ncbi:3-oxoacid CoA-transferase subunit B [Streptomyces brasiliensis]|uniref:Succinyl-CoA--3-ketoacid-CoA transferase n=1 Tax=Streptomyces brasiliensis TaxID=1954 RepID=A0A917L3D0_9ACTN|nr:3-oxoacid CoA-transferase subunit B [Streptomyces brasiliensis]GGJ42814.1 succinyl-CoA--3-ketoacid-CoA transferase [Streptomyces brasiliensis]
MSADTGNTTTSAPAAGKATAPVFKPKLEAGIGYSRMEIAARAARDLPDGAYVNLGIGMPQMVADVIPEGIEVLMHSENGILGMGPAAPADDFDPDLADSGKAWVTMLPGGAIFDSSDSFGIIRGGHLDVAMLGALEVAPNGDLANWTAPGRITGVGGAMDLAHGAKDLWVLSLHTERSGKSKLVGACTLPLTAAGVVTRVYTNLGVFRPSGDAFECLELAPGVTREQAIAMTDAPLHFVEGV